ncbi:SEC10/PgrA surface exclusion domain-containing protein [Streptococcus mitis]|uniref:SEC10/PgrA surface exclusion domain-containing protein n=1 Tax=Streptococcus mitis TaxID=28037 RepID=A0A4U1L7S7_STRMT|nr:SEC10/PgrA surface exclusion domain-containing protein [Streptococcus mitis]TKD52435.1 SEC10/PgrA surface exclusion domain-containing protein [Streptococcus mitis]
MNFKRSFALISTATLLAFSCSVVHADSARQSKIKELDNQRNELAKKNGDSGFEVSGRWYSLKESENKIKELEQQVAQLNVPYSEKNTIKVSAEYAKALKDYFNYDKSDAERDRAEQILKSESSKLRYQEENFISSASDQVEVYDINNLPKEVVVELNYFALDMLNQVRRQMGMPQVSLANSSIDFSDKLSKKVLEANRSIYDWHYVKGINDVAREYGLPTSSKKDEVSEYGGQYYENYFALSGGSSEMTKAEMKQWIHYSILEFLYNGSEFLHAQSIAGVNYGTTYQNEYLGVSLHYLKDGLGISYIKVSNEDLSKATKSVFNTSSPSNTTEGNRQATLAKKSKELQDEKGKYEKLQTAYNDYNKIVKEIDSLKSEEEKEKQEKAKKDKEKQNISPAKPSNPAQKQDKDKSNKPSQKQDMNKPSKPSQNQSKPSSSKNGWVKENGSWYYYLNGKPVSNQFQDSYYLKSDGKMAEKEWVYDSYYGSWFYLKEGGSYANSEWMKLGGSWFYFKRGGYMSTNTWLGSYYLKSNGAMAENEWIYDSNYKSWFFIKEGGSYANSEWMKLGGSWFYFKRGGYMAVNTWIGSNYLKSDGKMAEKEWVYDKYYNSWFFIKEDGSYANNEWMKLGGSWFYFKRGGYMAVNTWIGSNYLKSNGAMAVNEWIYDLNYKAWYYLKSDGSYARNEIVQGRYRVDYSGKWV